MNNFIAVITSSLITSTNIQGVFEIFDPSNPGLGAVSGRYVTNPITIGSNNDAALLALMVTDINTWASGVGVTLAGVVLADNVRFVDPVVAVITRTINNAPGRSIVTGTGATGFQPSATKDTWVTYDVSASVTSTIAGSSSLDIFLEVAPTNSATAGDWVKKGVVGTSQAFSLAITLQGVQVIKGQLQAFVPKGYYAKIRSAGTGTFTATYLEGVEVLEG